MNIGGILNFYMNINLELYKIFYITAKTGSMTKAASELFTSQPAISHSIKVLEEKLDGELFYRTAKGVSLTLEGKVLFKYIEQGYQLMQTGQRKFIEQKTLSSGQLRIAVSSTAFNIYLMKYLQKYTLSFPGINIYVKDQSTHKTIEELESGQIDIGILNLNKDKNSLNIVKKIKIQDCFVVNNKYEEIYEKQISLKSLVDNYPLILLQKGLNTRDYIDDYFSSLGLKVLPQIELSTMEMLIEFAKKGLGVSCVIEEFVQNELAQKQLYKVSIKEKVPERFLSVAINKNMPVSTAAQKFIDLLKE